MTEELAASFERASEYDRYVKSGTPEQQRRWDQVYQAAHLTERQRALVAGFQREMNILVISAIWCGDCSQQCPLLARIAESNPGRIHLRFVERDAESKFSSSYRINGGDRVPVAIFMAEDFEPCAVFGDRTLSRYRALALRQLGSACPSGITAPDHDELSAALADWLVEVERIQLMLRLSP
ncbi:MAG: thioredoxin family protein, partial [Tepidisphaeraceae bacterium]